MTESLATIRDGRTTDDNRTRSSTVRPT